MMLPITEELCFKFHVPYKKIINKGKGVFLDHLCKMFASMINEGVLPADAKMTYLYFDGRFESWAVLIESSMYPEVKRGTLAPLLELE